MLVRSSMTTHVWTASVRTTIAEALSLTRAHRIRHLPVLENGRVVGLVTERDLHLAMPPVWAADRDELMAALTERRVDEVMTTDVVVVTPDTPLEDAARELYTHRIGCLPVLDGETLVGILTERDVLRAFTDLVGGHSESARVEVQMPNRPGELARVMRIIGIEHRINIGGMVVPPLNAEAESRVIMSLQTADPAQIVHALRKCGYRVGTPSLDTDPDADFIPTSEHDTPTAVAGGKHSYARL
jgi:acetoin utilization protein AcuB